MSWDVSFVGEGVINLKPLKEAVKNNVLPLKPFINGKFEQIRERKTQDGLVGSKLFSSQLI